MPKIILASLFLLGAWAQALDFEPLGKGAFYAEADYQSVRYGIVKAHPEQVSLLWRDGEDKAYRSLSAAFSAVKESGRVPLMLMNAGIFTTAHTPAGLWVEQGEALVPLNRNKGKGNFHIEPNGVFSVTGGKARVETSAAFARRKARADHAVQSGPMLIVNGKINKRFVKNLSSPYKRNAVCTTKKGDLLFVMTLRYQSEWPSFYRLGEALLSFGCHHALYLDGSISDWFVKGKSGTFHWSNFVGIIAVTELP
ncbi:MAG: phosphodiester glycosidase family protein [Cardiobacteriaceae bacterium]|nr:phosphodiester glycosidase family protein [Cardiobacteriaceae bacterium]